MELRDTLARLNQRQALRLLGSKGEDLLRRGGNTDEQVHFTRQQFVLSMDEAEVTLTVAEKHGARGGKAGRRQSTAKPSRPGSAALVTQCSCRRPVVTNLRDRVQTREHGSLAFTVHLPDRDSLNPIAGTLAKNLLSTQQEEGPKIIPRGRSDPSR